MPVIHGIALHGTQCVPYILEPLPIDPEPPPRRIHQGARTILEGLMILIQDGNLSFMTDPWEFFVKCPVRFCTKEFCCELSWN
ncbi:hypothetical protein QN277_026118 [Acacia crassicarpa]|uniref:Uncharacterized protein n=1 Tax=Acacia crassicarpa TaxID=499986 RepID=A0AAE1K641_9FABA|nr:hypothetical protein QN277_026118 [Acacia crassicarpa]